MRLLGSQNIHKPVNMPSPNQPTYNITYTTDTNHEPFSYIVLQNIISNMGWYAIIMSHGLALRGNEHYDIYNRLT